MCSRSGPASRTHWSGVGPPCWCVVDTDFQVFGIVGANESAKVDCIVVLDIFNDNYALLFFRFYKYRFKDSAGKRRLVERILWKGTVGKRTCAKTDEWAMDDHIFRPKLCPYFKGF